MLSNYFPNGRFDFPASEAEINAAEAILGVRFPEQLRVLYKECNGFREDRGNAKYLLSLVDNDFTGSLVSVTTFYWTEGRLYWPKLDFQSYIFFGSSSGDAIWGICWKDSENIIAFHHQMEDKVELVGTKIIEVYRADYDSYDIGL